MATAPSREDDLIDRGARAICGAFTDFLREFGTITRRARGRFEQRDWHGQDSDAIERLEVYPAVATRAVSEVRAILGDRFDDVDTWKRIKIAYASLLAAEPNDELSETFYNTVTRKIFSTVGVNPEMEFVQERSAIQPGDADPAVYRRFESTGDTAKLIETVLAGYRFGVDFRDFEKDAWLASERIERHLQSVLRSKHIDSIETLRSVFYRNKGAYIVGRIRSGNHMIPVVVALLNADDGVHVDTVLLVGGDVSILFSFTRAYFHVEAECPRELIVFLKTIMPLKPIAELYTSIGLNRHGKTELYRSLRKHLDNTPDRFHLAAGDRGMVMVVFTLPFYDVVFKVIRDDFTFPKVHSRREVKERYRLVFKHDRVGRLVDAQEFEHLEFKKNRFSEELLHELTTEASRTVSVEGSHVVINHLYTERKVMPLNLFIRKSSERDAGRAVVDYGNASKELAAANVFPGDFLLKNFGVTPHGRVVFYDYDELCLLTDCNFRSLPPARTEEDELESETWFAVADNDVFPEEFERFLELDGRLRDLFHQHHSDLFTVEFWRGLQDRLRDGEIMDVFPYPEVQRFRKSAD